MAAAKKHGGKRKGAGRPPISDAATERLGLRLTPAEREQWELAADRERLTLSEWLRAAAELALARGSTR